MSGGRSGGKKGRLAPQAARLRRSPPMRISLAMRHASLRRRPRGSLRPERRQRPRAIDITHARHARSFGVIGAPEVFPTWSGVPAGLPGTASPCQRRQIEGKLHADGGLSVEIGE